MYDIKLSLYNAIIQVKSIDMSSHNCLNMTIYISLMTVLLKRTKLQCYNQYSNIFKTYKFSKMIVLVLFKSMIFQHTLCVCLIEIFEAQYLWIFLVRTRNSYFEFDSNPRISKRCMSFFNCLILEYLSGLTWRLLFYFNIWSLI